ncbi:MAG: diadenylate cyclase CdaA [Anaerovoracaceae bacterium]
MLESLMQNAVSILSSIRPIDVLDIAIVAFAIYKIIQFISKTRAQQIVNGLLILVAAMLIADVFNLYTVYFLLYNGLRYGILAILVIFYPELRRALEYLGRRRFNFPKLSADRKKQNKQMIDQMVTAIDYFSSHKVGALIVIERDVALGDILDHGTIIDGDTTALLLETIFYEGSALHDGAVVIRDGRVFAAGCVLPLSGNKNLEKTLGTRHRAGLGITEVSDAISLIVSEETGIISAASDGHLSRFLDVKSVEKILYDVYITDMEEEKPSKPQKFFGSIFREKKHE